MVEIGLAIFLLRLNANRARASELILLSEQTLRIVRTDRHGRREERVLPTGWLNAVMEEPAGKVPRLLLVARGVREEIATTLGEVEKRDLCGSAARGASPAAQPDLRQSATARGRKSALRPAPST